MNVIPAPTEDGCTDPLFDSANTVQLARVYRTVEDDHSDKTVSLAMCLALRMMSSRPAGALRIDELPQRFRIPWAHAKEHPERYLRQLLLDDPGLALIYDPDVIKQKHRSRAIVVAGLLTIRLRETYRVQIVDSYWTEFSHQPWEVRLPVLPPVEITSLHRVMEFTSPFPSSTRGDLGTSHLTKMSDGNFLEDGEWTGVYTLTFDPRPRSGFDPPMRNIRFKTEKHPHDPSVLELHADGRDGVALIRMETDHNRRTSGY